MSVADTIRNKLETALAPVELEVEDQSYLHRGHAGAPEGGESHFRVRIISAAFAGKTRLQRHKMVNEILADELAGAVHALTMVTDVPG